MAEMFIARLQTPADAEGKRQDVSLVTHAASVIVDEDTTLEEKLAQGGIVLSKEKPDFPCVWGRVISSSNEDN